MITDTTAKLMKWPSLNGERISPKGRGARLTQSCTARYGGLYWRLAGEAWSLSQALWDSYGQRRDHVGRWSLGFSAPSGRGRRW